MGFLRPSGRGHAPPRKLRWGPGSSRGVTSGSRKHFRVTDPALWFPWPRRWSQRAPCPALLAPRRKRLPSGRRRRGRERGSRGGAGGSERCGRRKPPPGRRGRAGAAAFPLSSGRARWTRVWLRDLTRALPLHLPREEGALRLCSCRHLKGLQMAAATSFSRR